MEIIFKDLYVKYGLIPLMFTIFMVLLIIVITIIFVTKELRKDGKSE